MELSANIRRCCLQFSKAEIGKVDQMRLFLEVLPDKTLNVINIESMSIW